MNAQARQIWDMVHYSRARGYRLRLGEVTASELNFFALRDYWTKGVYVVTNEPDEARTGADWEWLIGHGDKWLQIRVQAKILSSRGSFEHLGHPNRTGDQMQRLLNPDPGDTVCRYLPLYIFYAASPPAGVAVEKHAGCSAQIARRVQETFKPGYAKRATLAAAAHLPGSVPWANVFDGLVSRLRRGESLASVVDSLANRRVSAEAASIDNFWLVDESAEICHREIPEYVKAIVGRDGDEFDGSLVGRLNVNVRGRPNKGDDVPDLYDDGAASGRPEVAAQYGAEKRVQAFADDHSVHLPSRSISLDRSESDASALPNVVSVIDIDRLNPAALSG